MNPDNYGFIVLAPQYDASEQHASLRNELFRTEIVGVSSVEHAIDAARKMIEDGIQLIELCGGFGEEKAEQVITALDTHIPIGYVRFSTAEDAKLQVLLSEN